MKSDLSNIKLNEQQLEMLQLFKTPMPEEDYLQIRRLAVELLAKRLDQAVEEWEKENGITEEYYGELSKQHFRSSRKSDE
jgi:hypothetical protein